MSYRTLNAFTIKPTWPSSWGTSDAKLVIVLDRDVVSEDGVQYQGGENLGEGTALDSLGFYFSSDITVTGGVATADSIANLPTTDTSTPANSARYYAFIYVAGQHRETLTFQGFHLHESVNGESSTFSWQQWVVAQQFRQGSSQLPMIGDRVTMQAMVDAANLASGLATTTTPGRVLASVAPSASPVAVVTDDTRIKKVVTSAQFGFVGDDSTNNDAAIALMRTYLRANDGATVHFVHSSPTQRTYRFTDNLWLNGVRNVTVYFNGARLRNVTTSPWNALQTALRINHGWWSNDGDTFGSGTDETKNYINDASARALSVTLKVTANSSKFEVGDYVFLGGFDMQGAGFPDNLRYFEVNKVSAVNAGTGVITLESPLRWDYNDDWHGIAPFIISLNRSQFNVAENIRLHDVETLENTTPPVGFGAHGRNWSSGIEIGGVLNFYGRGIKTNYLGVSGADKVTIEDSEVFYSDLDKQVDVVDFRRCRYWYFLGGTGFNRLTFDAGEVLEQLQVNPREFVLTNSRVSGTHVSNQAKVYTPDYYSRQWTLKGNTFIPRAGESILTGMVGTGVVTATALTAPTADSITIAVDFDVIRAIGKGTVLRTAANKWCVVSDVVSNGSNITISGSWSSPPTAGDVFKFNPLINLSLDPLSNVWEGVDPKSRLYINGDSEGKLPAENWDEELDTVIYRLPTAVSTQRYIPIDGFIESVTVQIDTAYTGATANPKIYLDEYVPTAFGFRWFTVNVANKGTRTVEADGGAGAKSGDTLPASLRDADGNLRYARTLFLFNDVMASTDSSQLPKGFIKITVRRRR